MTAGSRTTSFGSPSAIRRPWSRTTRRSTSCTTAYIVCSMIATLTPASRTRRTSAAMVSTPSRESPASGSSNKIRSGALASQRAGDVVRPPQSDGGHCRQGALARAWRRRLVREGADHDVVEHGELREGANDLEGATDTAATDRARAQTVDRSPAVADLARVGQQEAVQHVEERGLAGA